MEFLLLVSVQVLLCIWKCIQDIIVVGYLFHKTRQPWMFSLFANDNGLLAISSCIQSRRSVFCLGVCLYTYMDVLS